LRAIGFSGPIPKVSIFVSGIPLSTKYFFITSALDLERLLLYMQSPQKSV
jgi:hypothetical protein